MFQKHSAGLAILFSVLMVFGALRAGAQGDSPSNATTIPAASTYEEKVNAVRQALSGERVALDLSNTTGQLSTPESDLGEPDCGNTGGASSGGGSGSSMASAGSSQQASCGASSKGAPVWRVNMVNLNFYMADTPLWYASPVGPAVEMKLSYNSQSSLSGSFGNKWRLNYGSYLYPAVDDNGNPAGILVIMPEGKQDLYTPAGAGLYKPPYHVFNTLTEVAANHFELKFPDGRVHVYKIPSGTASTVSLLAEMQDAYGQKLIMGYNAEAKLTTITDALGKVTTLSYNGDGLVVQAADPFGRLASFEYDTDRNLTKITDMGGYWTSFTYRHYVLTDYYLAGLTNAGGSWGFYFEPADKLAGADPYPAPGAATGRSARITVTNPFGGKEEYYHTGVAAWYVRPGDYIPYSTSAINNAAVNVPKTRYVLSMTTPRRGEVGSVSSPEGNTTGFSYNHLDSSLNNTGNMTSVANGVSQFAYTYNSMGKITSIENLQVPNHATVTNLTYAENSVDLTGITDGLGTRILTYNGAHDILSFTDRSGNTKTTAYNSYGKIVSTTDPLGITTNFMYDVNHRLSQVSRSGQILNSYTYDPVGRIQTETDATGMTRVYEYNNLNDVTKITYPDGKFISIAYSNAFPHLITAITDRGGKTKQYTYNASKKLTGILNAAGGMTDLIRDANGNLLQLFDPIDQATGFAYDKDNRLVRKTFADGSAASYTHDAAGRRTSVTGARNMSTSYGFDLNDNLASVIQSNASAQLTNMSMFQYDPYRRVTTMIDPGRTTAYTYNADSLLTGVDGPLANDTLTYQYDAKGRMTGYSLERGQSVSYTYDTLDRLTTISGSAGTFTYTYSGAGPLVRRLTRPNGSYTEYQYDALNRLILVGNRRASGETISQYEYVYNAQDLRATETITRGAAIESLQTGAISYAYNNVNALLSSTNPNRTFAYDLDGNMTQWDTPAGKTFTGVYDSENRLLSAGYEIVSGMQFESYQQTYKYGGDGMLAEKEVDYSKFTYPAAYEQDKKTVKYVRHGLLPLQERDGSNNNVLREYTWGANAGGGIGGLLSLNQGGQNYYYLYDGKGNVTAVIDSAQAVVATYAYDPFGNVMTKTGTLDQPYQFSTKPYDEAAGLSYFGYRFYAPSTRKWMSRDPLGETVGLNLYEFVKNDPVNRVDPTGLEDSFCGPGEQAVETSVDPDNDGPYTTWTCMPEKSTWEKIEDWLNSFVTPKEITADRAIGYQCRKVAGRQLPGRGWTGPEN